MTNQIGGELLLLITAPNYLARDLQRCSHGCLFLELKVLKETKVLKIDLRGCTARLDRSVRRHRFCTVTGHFQAALKDSSVWTIVRLTTDLVTCP